MQEPVFLNLFQIRRIHQEVVDTYGGSEGLRDMGLLESAIAQPSARYDDEYLHRDRYEMAAAYLFHIVSNHPFVDGNKRVGAAAAIIFLELNNIEIEADEDGLVKLTLATATGTATKQEIAIFLRGLADRTRSAPDV